jgi:hypothetical protein
MAEIEVAILEWEKSLSAEERGDPIWGLDVYRYARLALEWAREDARRHGACTEFCVWGHTHSRRGSWSVPSRFRSSMTRPWMR